MKPGSCKGNKSIESINSCKNFRYRRYSVQDCNDEKCTEATNDKCREYDSLDTYYFGEQTSNQAQREKGLENEDISRKELKTFPAKQEKLKKGDEKITDVKSVSHIMKVTFDQDKGVFASKGVPNDWKGALNKQFGVSPKQLPCVQLPNYSAKIPKVLVELNRNLVAAKGYEQMGIFRVQPDAKQNNAIKISIDSGDLEINDISSSIDVNVFANLIKVWFRELPEPLFHSITLQQLEMISEPKHIADFVSHISDPFKSIFLWLCDICIECASYEHINKMGHRNLAIVIGPNLFGSPRLDNPTKAVMYSAKMVDFFEKAIKWRESCLSQNNRHKK